MIGLVIFLSFTMFGLLCLPQDLKIPAFQFYKPQAGANKINISFDDFNLSNELAIFGITMGLLMIVFDKEKYEDNIFPCLD